MQEILLKNLPSWSIGIAFILLVTREIYLSMKDKNPMLKALKRYQEIYEILEEVEEETNASRVVLLKAHDSGKELTPKTKLYSSVLFSTSKGELRGVANTWKQQILDVEYIEMLMRLSVKKQISIKTENLPPSMLKRLYESDDIKVSYVAEVSQITKRSPFWVKIIPQKTIIEYFYISINFQTEEVDNSYISEELRKTANKIKSIIVS